MFRLHNSCIVYERKTKDCACLLLWRFPGFITISLYTTFHGLWNNILMLVWFHGPVRCHCYFCSSKKSIQFHPPLSQSLSLFICPSIFYRLPDLVEYIVEPLLTGLGDNSSYVRRCAVMGCVKLYHLIPDFVEGKKWPPHSTPSAHANYKQLQGVMWGPQQCMIVVQLWLSLCHGMQR